MFFFEKKNQKTFANLVPAWLGARAPRDATTMAIHYDDATKEASDSVSGLRIAYLYNDYWTEQQVFVKLSWLDQAYTFPVHYRPVSPAHPSTAPAENSVEAISFDIGNYILNWFPDLPRGVPDRIILDRLNVFLELITALARNHGKNTSTRVVFAPWNLAKTYHRQTEYPPLQPIT
jgi:hypothetical protein